MGFWTRKNVLVGFFGVFTASCAAIDPSSLSRTEREDAVPSTYLIQLANTWFFPPMYQRAIYYTPAPERATVSEENNILHGNQFQLATRSVGEKQEPYHSGPEWELIVRDLINRKETVYVFPQCQLLSVMTQSDDLSNIVLRRDGVSTLDEGWSRRRTYRVGNLLCARLISCACRPISSAPVDITRNYAPAPASN